MESNVALTALFAKEFEWCRVRAGESVAVVTEPASPSSYLATSIASLTAMGARPFQVMLPFIRDYMARWKDRNAYGISHVGWGLHERGLWHALSLYGNTAMGLDGRVFEGNFLFSTGPNHAAGRHSGCHFDIPMRHCSIFLDGAPIVIDGVIVEPSIRHPGA